MRRVASAKSAMKHLKTQGSARFPARRIRRRCFIDCRSEMEYFFVGHPVGAQHVAWNDGPDWDINPHFVGQVKKVASMNRPIVLICRSGHRSVDAGVALEKAGFAEVYNVLGRLRRAARREASSRHAIAGGARGPALGTDCSSRRCRQALAAAGMASDRLRRFLRRRRSRARATTKLAWYAQRFRRSGDARARRDVRLRPPARAARRARLQGSRRRHIAGDARALRGDASRRSACDARFSARTSPSSTCRSATARAFIAGGAFQLVTDPAAARGRARAHSRASRGARRR